MKAAPDKSLFILTRNKFHGHIIEKNTKTPLKSRIEAIRKLQPPTSKKKMQEIFGMLFFLGKYLYKKHLYLRPFYNILRQQITLNGQQNTKHNLKNSKNFSPSKIQTQFQIPIKLFMQCAMLQILASVQLYYNLTMERIK